MTFKLRPYQQSVLDATRAHIKYFSEEHGYIVAAGGSGKSVMIASVAEACYDMGKRVCLLARSEKLLRQNRDKFGPEYYEHTGMYCAGLGLKELDKPITVASIQSIARAKDIPQFDVMLVDEAHNINETSEGQYWDFWEAAGKPQIIGFTATAFRTGTGRLQWGREVMNVPIEPLFKAGFIVRPKNKMPKQLDTSNVTVRMGEFVERELEELFIDPEMYEASVKTIQKYGADSNSVVIFCQSRKHARMIAEAIGGISVDGETPKQELADILDRFERREFKYLVNCQLLTEGYDAPNVDCVVILRSTVSKGMFEQMVYRGTRPYEGKDSFYLVDMGSNLARHGPLGSPSRDKGNPKKGEPAAAMKACPECEEAVPSAQKECGCGYVFPVEQRQVGHDYGADTDSDTTYAGPKRYTVTDVEYSKHHSKSGNICVKVTYMIKESMYDTYSEYFAIWGEHDFPRQKFDAFAKKIGMIVPDGYDWKSVEVESVLDTLEGCNKPHSILVDTSGKYPRIVSADYSKPMEVEEICDNLDDEIPF